MKRIFLIFYSLLLSITVLAAGKNLKIEFDHRDYDFGTIKEANGPVSHTFEFKNVSDEPVSIIRATASCGCTRPEYSEEPIKAGKKSKIKVTYNPAGRPGEFDRKVTLRIQFATGKQKRIILSIKGVVIPDSDNNDSNND